VLVPLLAGLGVHLALMLAGELGSKAGIGDHGLLLPVWGRLAIAALTGQARPPGHTRGRGRPTPFVVRAGAGMNDPGRRRPVPGSAIS